MSGFERRDGSAKWKLGVENLTEQAALGLNVRWTGHPIMDMGVAGHLAFADKDEPAELTADDLREFQKWAERAYFSVEMKSWIYVVFTLNGFLNQNSAWTDAMRLQSLRDVLTSYERSGLLPERCAFFPELPAQQRVARDLFPMLMGRGPMNFYPGGQPGVPLSGLAISLLQGLSVAAPLVSGKAVVLDADDPRMLLAVVRRWSDELRKRAQMSLEGGARLDIWAAARTRLVEALREVLKAIPKERSGQGVPFRGGITLYHLSNSGQGPDVRMYPLLHPAIRFLQLAETNHQAVWGRLVGSARRAADKDKDARYGTYNALDEALFSLPDEAPSFIRRFFMPPFTRALASRTIKAGKKARGPNDEAQAFTPSELRAVWEVTELFLKEVVGMHKDRVDAVRALGDRLGNWIADETDKKLFRALYEARGAVPLRGLLLRATKDKVLHDARKGMPHEEQTLIVTAQQYLDVFMEQDEVARADFTLARDLLKMRVIEVLHARDFFSDNKDDEDLKDLEVPAEEER